ncbi:efflux RND transporter periplasmic adaptor subunit [Geobacter hydrogenophilus]|uniref:RND transporter n=1 Tax=Geobacter hydrogenophilus TaxID=40983 RepID=A0A9W6G3V3_9BACT|nr:efflux RND transporter periplasmic adaptor subunit [Geobacter hydrogenophilus]MBT0892462.1 efflux RND transporter periplasmic adaptor subunit [Geobacter hydrogenophilus]GLI39858.1 RND transporter [Geobacter hydrogenophilus]
MNVSKICMHALLLFAVPLAGCKGDEAKKSMAVKPPVAVEVIAVAARDLVEGVEVTGSLEPKFYADVKTQIPGLVKQVYVTEWLRVRKGTPLARIDVAEVEAMVKRAEASVESARAGLAQAQVGANRAERELTRILKLKESGLATQQGVDDARTESAAAQARIEAAQAQIRVAQEEVRQARARQAKGLVVSPLDGVVALRDVNVGDLASDAATSKPIFRIVDNRVLNLTVTVPSADSARVKVGQLLEFTVDALPGKTFTGRVMYINPELSSADRSLRVIAEVRNDGDRLKGGLFVKGRIITGQRPKVVQVPRGALTTWDTAARKGSLFVVAGTTAKLRQVETGAVSGDSVEIVKGVGAGEQIVARGGFNLKDGDAVSVAGGRK